MKKGPGGPFRFGISEETSVVLLLCFEIGGKYLKLFSHHVRGHYEKQISEKERGIGL